MLLATIMCCITQINRLHITFIDKEGVENHFEVAEGDNLLDIAHSNNLEMEGNDIKRIARFELGTEFSARCLRGNLLVLNLSRYC